MIPYDEYELSTQQLNDLKAKNQRHAVYQYIKQHGVEPDYETTQSFYSATQAQIDHERMVQYSVAYDPTPSPGPTPHDYSRDYLTFRITDANNKTLKWRAVQPQPMGEPTLKTISYSKDNGNTWVEITSSSEGTNIPVSNGDVILFKGNNDSYVDMNTFTMSSFYYSSVQFTAEGNIMSLIYGDNFITQTAFPNNSMYNIGVLFCGCALMDAENLILPATTLSDFCYSGMFQHTYITKAPVLPAPTLANGCYQSMFEGCSDLNYIKCLATDISASDCTNSWLHQTAASGTFVKPASMTDWTEGANGIPSGWTTQDA